MKFVTVTEEDLKRELDEKIANLKEDQKSKFEFEDHPFYKIGHGHCFGRGFYVEYVTKSGIHAYQFGSVWHINGDTYDYIDEEYAKRPTLKPSPPIDLSKITFPVVAQVAAKTIGLDIVPVIPKNKSNEI